MTNCCPLPGVYAPHDYATPLSARPFLERAGLLLCRRGPLPRIQPSTWAIQRYPTAAPLPLPEYQRPLLGDPPPDRGQTFDWPHPTFPPETP